MKLYRVFGSLHYNGSCYAPFVETTWTTDKESALNTYNNISYSDFKKADENALFNAKMDAIPLRYEKPSTETLFLWIELDEVEINSKTIPADHLVLEIADYNQKEIAERGIFLNGKKMSDKTFKQIIY